MKKKNTWKRNCTVEIEKKRNKKLQAEWNKTRLTWMMMMTTKITYISQYKQEQLVSIGESEINLCSVCN